MATLFCTYMCVSVCTARGVVLVVPGGVCMCVCVFFCYGFSFHLDLKRATTFCFRQRHNFEGVEEKVTVFERNIWTGVGFGSKEVVHRRDSVFLRSGFGKRIQQNNFAGQISIIAWTGAARANLNFGNKILPFELGTNGNNNNKSKLGKPIENRERGSAVEMPPVRDKCMRNRLVCVRNARNCA